MSHEDPRPRTKEHDEGTHLAGHPRRRGQGGRRPRDRAGHRRGDPHHVDRDLRIRPPPLRGLRTVPREGRRARPREHGRRRAGRQRRHEAQGRRPRRRPLRHRVPRLLHVRQGPVHAVRDHAGEGAGQRRRALRLQRDVRIHPRRPGRAPPHAARRRQRDRRELRAPRRALPLPQRHPPHRLAGRAVRERARGRHARRHGPRPGRPVRGPHRQAPRLPRHRGGSRRRAPRHGRAPRRRDPRPHRRRG